VRPEIVTPTSTSVTVGQRPGHGQLKAYPPKRRLRRIMLLATRAAPRTARELGSDTAGAAAPNSISGMLKLPRETLVLEKVALLKGVVEIRPSNTNLEVS